MKRAALEPTCWFLENDSNVSERATEFDMGVWLFDDTSQCFPTGPHLTEFWSPWELLSSVAVPPGEPLSLGTAFSGNRFLWEPLSLGTTFSGNSISGNRFFSRNPFLWKPFSLGTTLPGNHFGWEGIAFYWEPSSPGTIFSEIYFLWEPLSLRTNLYRNYFV